jgi:hypothetical protein
MIRASSHKRWFPLTLTVAVVFTGSALVLGCGPLESPTIPLYPNSQTTRLPRSEVAEVAGPIEKIDGNEVAGWHGFFDLLPGCHVVELEPRLSIFVVGRPARGSGSYQQQFGPLPLVTYALRMKAGARYIIRHEPHVGGGFWSISGVYLSAREEQPNGPAIDLAPMQSADEIKACKEWAATSPRG